MRTSDFVVVRTAPPAVGMEKAIRRAIAAIDPNQPVFLSRSMGALVADSFSGRRFILLLLAATALLALAMAAAGVYGVVSYSTSQRTAEIGIRIGGGSDATQHSRDGFPSGLRRGRSGLACGHRYCAGFRACAPRFPYGSGVGTPWQLLGCRRIGGRHRCDCVLDSARRATRTDPATALRQD